MNTKHKLTRLVVGASLGSILWAGCSTSSSGRYSVVTTPGTYIAENNNTTVRTDQALMATEPTGLPVPVNAVKRRPDTHPELRSGLWDLVVNQRQPQAQNATVIETPHTNPFEPVADTTSLMTQRKEAQVAIAAAPPTALPGAVIVEAAGARRPSEADLEAYKQELLQRVREDIRSNQTR
jgi:hypothetical protein